jgi:hypothetical protein
MKSLLLALLVVFFTGTGFAQSKSTLIFGDAVQKYKKMETAGTVLTVIGSVTLFTGNILYWKINNEPDNGEPDKTKMNTYRYLMFGGLGMMSVGIPLWAIGKTKERHIRIEADLIKYKGSVWANGIGIKMRF